MSCKCKNIIQNFEGGVIPLTTTFLSPVYFSGNTYHSGSIFSGGTNLLDIFCTAPCGGGATFTGGSANCIDDLYLTNMHGCSPITVHDDLILLSGLTLSLPLEDNSSTQILSRDAVSGNIKYRNVNSIISAATSVDTFVTGGTFSDITQAITLTRNDGFSIPITGISSDNFYVTGFTYSPNTLTLNQNGGLTPLSTTLNSFNSITITGMTVDGTAHFNDNVQVDGSVLVLGNVTILGTATTIHTESLSVADNIITLNATATGNTVPFPIDSGIDILRNSADTAVLLWEELNGYWAAGISGATSAIVLNATNNGGGEEVFKDKTTTNLNFRTLSAGTNTTLTTVGDVIKVDVTVPPYSDTNIYNTDGVVTTPRTVNLDGNSLTLTGGTTVYRRGGGSDVFTQYFHGIPGGLKIRDYLDGSGGAREMRDGGGSAYYYMRPTYGMFNVPVLIGGSGTPTTGFDLDVQGNALVNSGLTVSDGITANTTATSSLLVESSSSNKLLEIPDNGDSSIWFAKTSGTFNFKEYTSGLNMVRIHGTGNVGKLSVLNGNFEKIYLSASEGMFFNATGTAAGITQVGLGVTSDSHTILNPRISTADITANITTPLAGMQVYDSTLNELQYYNGTSWVSTTGGGGFTGNTSATCINDLWVSSISGCSPVTIGPEVNVDGPLTITASGNTQPVFNVLGSSGQLFSINDSLVGELFSVNDISGIPIFSVNSNNNILMGDFDAPSLNTTLKKIVNTGTTILYDIPVSAYTSAYFDYNIVGNGSARAGNVMAIWSGTSLTYSETSTSDIGDTSPVTLSVSIAGSNTSFIASATTNNWVVKSIVRSI